MKKPKPSDPYRLSDKVLAGFFTSVWGILLIFGILTLFPPQWLIDISKPGRAEESQAYIIEANRLMYSANSNNVNAQYEQAIANYKAALKIDSTNAQVMANIGVAYIFLNQLEDAKAAFDKSYRMDTVNKYLVYSYYGDYYERKGDFEKALEVSLISSETHTNPAYPLRKAGSFCIKLQRYPEAIKYLQQAIEHEHSFADFYRAALLKAKYQSMTANDLSMVALLNTKLEQKDLTSELIRYDQLMFDQGHEISKDLGYAYMYLGDACMAISDFSTAANSYQNSGKYWPQFVGVVKDKLALALAQVKK